MSAGEDLFGQRRAEVLRLTYAENLGIRAIARRLSISRKTVRRLLDGDRATKKAAAAGDTPSAPNAGRARPQARDDAKKEDEPTRTMPLSHYISWSELLRRTFQIDTSALVARPRCA